VCQAVLDAQAASGATLLIVEHRVDIWADHVDRIIVLGESGLVADGAPDAVLHDPALRGRLESAKSNLFDSPRVGALAAEAWNTAKNGLLTSLADPESGLRRRAVQALQEVGERLTTDAALQRRVDTWVSDAAVFLVDRYRHDIASIITDTVEKWDPAETTEKIELMVGRDLQYIRLNGTVVGALAGLAIFTVAHALIPGV